METCTVKLPVAPELRVRAVGEKAQRASVGRASQAKVKLPEEPLRGVRTRVYEMLWPEETDWTLEPETVRVKSNPAPVRGTDAPVGSVEVETVREPVCWPAEVGTNSTPAVQLAPGPRAAGQVLLTSWKPAGTARARALRVVAAPVLVTVTVVGELARPTPVVAKLMAAGATWMAAASAPVPLKATVATLTTVAEVTVKEPVCAPVEVGAKTTPTVQLEPAASEVVQVFCVREKPAVTESASWVAATVLELLTVTVWTALVEPATAGEKVNCAGATLSPAVTVPAPLSGTVRGVTPAVDEVMVSVARLLPAVDGVKMTWTVQLAAGASAAVQVVAPVVKLALPVIWKPRLAAGTPPLLVRVRVSGAGTAPTACVGKARLVGLAERVAGWTPKPESGTCCAPSRIVDPQRAVCGSHRGGDKHHTDGALPRTGQLAVAGVGGRELPARLDR